MVVIVNVVKAIASQAQRSASARDCGLITETIAAAAVTLAAAAAAAAADGEILDAKYSAAAVYSYTEVATV